MAMIEAQFFTSTDYIIRLLSNLIKLAWKKSVKNGVLERATKWDKSCFFVMATIEAQIFTSADCNIRFLSNLIKLAWKE